MNDFHPWQASVNNLLGLEQGVDLGLDSVSVFILLLWMPLRNIWSEAKAAGNLAFQLSPNLQHGVNVRTKKIDKYMHDFFKPILSQIVQLFL